MRNRYPFQKIVDLKSSEKTQAEWVLTQAFGKLHDEENSLNQLHIEKESQHQLLSALSNERSTISEILLIQNYIGHLEQQIVHKNREIRKAQTDVDMKQDHLTGRMQDEKVWSKAKEKFIKNFLSVIEKKEQNELDESTTMRLSN